MAAALACGPRAALSHLSAAEHHRLWTASGRPIHVTCAVRRSRPGIRSHEGKLLRRDVALVRSIPCIDLRGLERVVDQAEVRRLLRMREVDDVLARSSGRRGATNLRTVLAIENEPAITKSEMEELFLELCLTLLIVETDSKRWHGTTRRREKDNARDRRLQLAGWRVLRFSWRAVAEEPAAVAEELRAFLRGTAAPRIAS